MPDQFTARSPADLPDQARILSMSGLEFIEAIRDGKIGGAPIAGLMNFHIHDVSHGKVTFRGAPEFHHFNPMGGVHGGWYGTILDSALGCAVATTLPVEFPRQPRIIAVEKVFGDCGARRHPAQLLDFVQRLSEILELRPEFLPEFASRPAQVVTRLPEGVGAPLDGTGQSLGSEHNQPHHDQQEHLAPPDVGEHLASCPACPASDSPSRSPSGPPA